MKNTLALLCALCASVATYAAPTYRVDNLGNCYQVADDGTEINIGQPADAIRNHPEAASGIQKAALKLLADFQAKQSADLTAAQDAAAASVKAAQDSAAEQIAAARKSAADASAAAKAASDQAIAANAAELAAAKKSASDAAAEAATAKAALAADDRDARLAAASAYIEKLRAQLRALNAEPVAP